MRTYSRRGIRGGCLEELHEIQAKTSRRRWWEERVRLVRSLSKVTAATDTPQITQNIARLVERDVDVLGVGEVGDIVEEHSKAVVNDA